MIKKPYLIAEIGINHNGDINLVKKLIDQAISANFDAVKFQKRDIDLVYSEELLNSYRESPWGKTQREQKKGLELSKSDYDDINNYCNRNKIEWFASAWDINSLTFLDQYNLKYHKIASAMIIDNKFLEEVAKRKKHTFISTGMSEVKDITSAVEIFRKNHCSFELMHCVSTYPTKPTDVNLLTINSLKKKFNCDVGYSGHENGVVISLGAVALGITSLERHITLDRTMYGSDQAASITPTGLKSLISDVRILEKALTGNEKKVILDSEKPVAEKLRSHIKSK